MHTRVVWRGAALWSDMVGRGALWCAVVGGVQRARVLRCGHLHSLATCTHDKLGESEDGLGTFARVHVQGTRPHDAATKKRRTETEPTRILHAHVQVWMDGWTEDGRTDGRMSPMWFDVGSPCPDRCAVWLSRD